MKKIISLLVVLVICVLALASCQKEIGQYLEKYDYEETVTEQVTVNLYIPVEEGTSDNAVTTVTNRIASVGKADFTAIFNLKTFKASEYDEKVAAEIASHAANTATESAKYKQKTEEISSLQKKIADENAKGNLERNGDAVKQWKEELAEVKARPINYSVDLVLIDSYSLFNQLHNGEVDYLYDLTPYMNGTEYGRLNTQITNSLLSATRIEGKYFAIPNNHPVKAGYTYLVINKEKARDTLHFSPEELLSLKSLDEAKELIYKDYFIVTELGSEETIEGYSEFTGTESRILYDSTAIDALLGAYDYGELDTKLETMKSEILTALNFDSAFSIEEDKRYEDKATYEAAGNYCNIIRYPTVTREEAYGSAFAIANPVGPISADRAMKILYAMNTDYDLHNLLIYGISGTNYIEVGDVAGTKLKTVNPNDAAVKESDKYIVNKSYAGDQFKTYYSGEWDATAAENADHHNRDSVSDVSIH